MGHKKLHTFFILFPVLFPVFQDILEDSVPVYVAFLVMMAWALVGLVVQTRLETGPTGPSLVPSLVPRC